jgi:hypothetical protein
MIKNFLSKKKLERKKKRASERERERSNDYLVKIC